MIDNAALKTILATADDFTVVAEVYPWDAHPEFAPGDAEKRFAPIGGLTFTGETYERRIVKFNRVKRTVSKEVNRCSLTLDNLDGGLSAYEFSDGFEGKILVLRLISRSLSDSLEKSLILFVGRCERPDTADRVSITMSAAQVVGALGNEVPRRRFQYDDPEGRPFTDPLFEGFRYQQQFGVIDLSKRKRTWWSLGLYTRTIRKFMMYSSFSDIDANKAVPLVLGRAQIMGLNLRYADVGSYLHVVTAFCEGPIEDLVNIRTDDTRFQFYDNSAVPGAGTPHINKYDLRYGYPALTGPTGRVQNKYVPHTGDATGYAIEGDGYYSRTAFLFGLLKGTSTLEVDPAPGIIAVVLGQLVTVPDPDTGDWTATDQWTDNPAAHVYFLLTSPDYGKLDTSWIDEASFTEAFNYNKECIYDSSLSDVVLTPDLAKYDDGAGPLGQYLATTGLVTPKYFGLLAGDATNSETNLRTPLQVSYPTDGLKNRDYEDPDPDDLPGTILEETKYVLRRRYTSNLAITENIKTADLLGDTICAGSRMFLSQGEDGRLRLRHKRPSPNGRASGSLSGTSVALDDVREWKERPGSLVLVDPNTTVSEVRTAVSATYSTATPTIAVDKDGTPLTSFYLTATEFTGAGGATPKTATITAIAHPDGPDRCSFAIDGTWVTINLSADDTVASVAGWVWLAVNGHPELGRRFRAEWTPGDDTVTISQVAGTVTLDSALAYTHAAAISNPTTGAALTGATTGTLKAGVYNVCYSYVNARGETAISPNALVTLTDNKKIDVSAVTPPSGATSVRWYCSVEPGGSLLRFVKENDGGGFSIDSLPSRSARVPNRFNTTGCEVMKVEAVFSDRAETRSASPRSNVLKGTFKWRLGNRAEAKNTVDVTFRDATQDFRLTTLTLKDEEHIRRTGKTSKVTVDGSAIDNYNQAYRIASGALAENLDADFFYQWSSDRTAMLLEEGDVVAITDAGSGVVNLPVRIEDVEIEIDGSFPTVSYTARKYSTGLYDDSVAERQIPVIMETGFATAFAP